jgi:hypothetical protein
MSDVKIVVLSGFGGVLLLGAFFGGCWALPQYSVYNDRNTRDH